MPEEQVLAFASRYIAHGNACRTAREIGIVAPSDAALAVKASRLLALCRKRGLLAAQVAQIQTASKMEAEEVIERLSVQARADLGAHLAWDDRGRPLLRVSREHTAIVRELTERQGPPSINSGEPQWVEHKIKVADPRPALEALARIHGLDGTRPPEKPVVNLTRQTFLVLLSNPETRAKLNDLARVAVAARAKMPRLLPGGNGNGG